MSRHLSTPTSSLFQQADVSADHVYAALDGLIASRKDAILRPNHPLIQQVRAATGINLVQVGRRSRYLLIEIEQHRDGAPSWQYRELAPRRCMFSCRGQLPDTIEEALQGELLEKLVIPSAVLQGTTIADVGKSGDGWLNVAVLPQWHEF